MNSASLPALSGYKGLKKDLLAGLTVAVIIIPQGMAYALLAGLPAIYGLYAAFVPLLVYPLFGSSKQLSVGPVALISIIVLAGLSQWAVPGSPEYIELALLTSMVAGAIQILLATIRMGFMVKFLSEPVVAGFTTAAALIIALSQLKYILGIEMTSANDVIGITKGLISGINQTHGYSLLLGGLAILTIISLKQVDKKIPGALISITLGALAVYFFRMDLNGVSIVGEVPEGLPMPDVHFINTANILKVTPLALVICIVSFIESLAISKTIAERHRDSAIDADKELLGLGMAKFIGSFFQAFPNTGSFTRSAINDEAGATSGYSSIFSGIFLGLILLFCTPLFYYLPKPILGAIVIAAVYGLIKIKYARDLFNISKREFLVFLTTALLTLLLGIQEGVFAGIVLSLIIIVQQASSPHFAILGRLPDTNSFRNIDRYPEAITYEGILIVRYDESLYFANADHFYDTVLTLLEKHPDTHTIVLNCTSITYIDTTGIHKLQHLIETLKERKVKLLLSHLRGPVRDLFEKCGLIDRIGFENNYLTTRDAVEGNLTNSAVSKRSRKYASQRNKKKKEKP